MLQQSNGLQSYRFLHIWLSGHDGWKIKTCGKSKYNQGRSSPSPPQPEIMAAHSVKPELLIKTWQNPEPPPPLHYQSSKTSPSNISQVSQKHRTQISNLFTLLNLHSEGRFPHEKKGGGRCSQQEGNLMIKLLLTSRLNIFQTLPALRCGPEAEQEPELNWALFIAEPVNGSQSWGGSNDSGAVWGELTMLGFLINLQAGASRVVQAVSSTCPTCASRAEPLMTINAAQTTG